MCHVTTTPSKARNRYKKWPSKATASPSLIPEPLTQRAFVCHLKHESVSVFCLEQLVKEPFKVLSMTLNEPKLGLFIIRNYVLL